MAEQSSPLGKDFILFANKASKLIDEGNIKQALNLCEAGVRRFPFYSSGHYVMGLCYEASDKNEDAKNEFERTLMYDPSHYKAMRKLSEFHQKSGVKELANDFLIREHLYNPLDNRLVEILKEKKLYDQLSLEQNDKKEAAEEHVEQSIEEDVQESIVTEETADIEKNIPDSSIKEETIETEDEPILETSVDDEEHNEHVKDDSDLFDPLSGNIILDDDDFSAPEKEEEEKKPHKQDLSQYDNTSDDFSTIMDGFFDKQEKKKIDEANIDNDDWIEVENLLIEEEEEIQEAEQEEKQPELKDVDPISEEKDETELLLEELSHSDLISEREDEIVDNDMDFETKSEEQPDIEANEQSVDETFEDKEQNTNQFTEKDENIYVPDVNDELVDEPEAGTENEDQIAEKGEDVYLAEADDYQDTTATFEAKLETAEGDVSIRDMMENPILVTPTFGEILIAQRKFSQARHVFLELSKKEPDNTRFIKKIEFLDRFLEVQNT